MTDQNREAEIRRLARELGAARERMKAMSLMNIAGRSDEDRRLIDEEYAVACAEVMRLQGDLTKAQSHYAERR